MRVLVVEDEPRLATLVRRGLTEEGHAVDIAESGEDALEWLCLHVHDVVILDIMLPGINGIEVCRRARQARMHLPIILLTAKDSIEDRVRGLDAGADDYLIKPFAFAELAARLRALTRRPQEAIETILEAGDLRIDPARMLVWKGTAVITLANKEFRILEYLMRNPNLVLTRTMIANHVWDYDFPNVTNVIDVHIRSLRKKLDDPYPGSLIQTVRGVGYRIQSGDV
jgi:DNA-binding response OmpR family regulator